MVSIICLWWLGLKLCAPTWYFCLLGISASLYIIRFGVALYKAGQKNTKEE